MNWLPNLPRIFPAFFKYSSAFDFGRGYFHKVQHTTRVASSMIMLIYTTCSFAQGGIFSFAIFHDALFTLLFFLPIELSLVMKKEELTDLVNFIFEPVKVGRSSIKRLKYQIYFKYITLYALCPVIITPIFGLAWPLILSILSVVGYNKLSVDLPMIWMINTDTTWLFVATTLFIVAFMLNNVALVQGWFLIMSVAITKLNLLTGIMIEDLTHLDEMAAERCEELLESLDCTGRLPLCPGCEERPAKVVNRQILHQRGFTVVLDTARSCCRRAYRDILLQYCQSERLKCVIVQHQKILRLTRSVDRVYRMTILTFTYAVILIFALVVPLVDKLNERTLAENTPAVLEAIGTPLFFIIFCCLGQFLTHQSEQIRKALYSCNWEDKPMFFRRSVALMQTVADKDFQLTAGGLYTLRLKLLLWFFELIFAYSRILQWMKTRDLLEIEN